MEASPDKGREFIEFHHKRKTINLCKSFLFLLEDLKGSSITEEKYQNSFVIVAMALLENL